MLKLIPIPLSEVRVSSGYAVNAIYDFCESQLEAAMIDGVSRNQYQALYKAAKQNGKVKIKRVGAAVYLTRKEEA